MDNRLLTFQYHRRTDRRPSLAELKESKDISFPSLLFFKDKLLGEGRYGKAFLFQNSDPDIKVVIKEEKTEAEAQRELVQAGYLIPKGFTQGLAMWEEGMCWKKR